MVIFMSIQVYVHNHGQVHLSVYVPVQQMDKKVQGYKQLDNANPLIAIFTSKAHL